VGERLSLQGAAAHPIIPEKTARRGVLKEDTRKCDFPATARCVSLRRKKHDFPATARCVSLGPLFLVVHATSLFASEKEKNKTQKRNSMVRKRRRKNKIKKENRNRKERKPKKEKEKRKRTTNTTNR